MDTPEKTQIVTPLSKFEDSPVFNYINSLSPIKPVKSAHINQTFNSLSFSSLPSVFTSPHVSSLKESRFFIRHTNSDPSKTEFSSEDGNKVSKNEGVVVDAGQLYDNSAELQENFDPGVSIGEASAESPSEHLKFAIELPQTLKYDCGSPDCDATPSCIETNGAPESAGASVSLVPFVQENEKGSSEGGVLSAKIGNVEAENNKVTGCDWDSLISDAADLLIFSSPNGSEAFKGLIQKSLDPGTRFCASLMPQFPQNDIDGVPKMQTSDVVSSIEQHEDPSPQTREASQLREINQTQENIGNSNMNKCMESNLSDEVNDELGACVPFSCELVSNLHRGMRRRCLDFETLAARRKNLGDGSNSSSSIGNQAASFKAGGDSLRCILPGIGLHLNALAIALKDCTNVKPDSLPPGRQRLSLPTSSVSLNSPTIGQEPLHESLTSAPTKGEMEPAEDGVQLAEDASQASAYLISEEFNQISPKKKKRRLEQAGESEACKRCNCKKSKCLKLYCECFAAGVYCIEPCSCLDCFNKPIHEDTVLATRKQIESRNPLAFAPKVIRSSDSVPEIGLDESNKTPASARHKRGCNCKKSSCLKKYCECFQGGVGCSINCRCEGCKNAFGRKDGSALMGTEAEPEEEAETCEKSGIDKSFQKPEILIDEEQNPSSALPTTPLQLYSPLVQRPFSSKSKPPRSLLAIGSSSGYSGQKYGKPNILRSQPKFEKNFQTFPEDEIPEILRGNSSPSASIKTGSPNSKRVSPPHCESESTPSRRSGRKLILQSIPSFPSLTPQH